LTFNSRPVLLILIGIFLLLGACNVTKNIPEGDYLLVKNKIKINARKVSSDDLSGYLQQTPNSRFLWIFRPGIALYNWGSKGKETKFKKWLRTKIGSEPVILDTSLVTISKKQMDLYLNNVGHFNSVLTDSIFYRKKKAKVYYKVQTSTPYIIRNLTWLISDTTLARFVYKDSSKCLIKRGLNYNAYTLDKERTRIATTLLNHGYYRFTTAYIVFQVDSTLNNHKMDVTIELLNPVVPSLKGFGMVTEAMHRRFMIYNIYVNSQFDNEKADTLRYDTLVATYADPFRGRNSITYYFLYREKMKIRPRTIAQNILIEPDTWYNLKEIDQTYSRLSGLQTFRFINIDFDDVNYQPDTILGTSNLLNCKIKMARAAGQALTWSTDGTNSGGAFGITGNIGYSNRNIFRGAQMFKITLSGSAQMQAGGGRGGLFNTLELGINTSITFPQFLIPIKQEKLSKSFRPKTILSAGYNFQQKIDPDYNRHIVNLSFGYDWIQNPQLSHRLNPIEVLLVKVFPSREFTKKLDSLQDKRFKNQYTDHMIAGLKYTLTFSNQDIRAHRNFIYIRTNFETSGNLLYGITSLFKTAKNSEGQFTLFSIPYSQYIRPDLDFRFYNQFRKGFSVVYRFYGGIGIPYGNSKVLPFEKAFIAGGANDMRGWRMGDLGPGTFHNDTVSQNFGQLGDMQLQLQIEYRFPIYSFLKGALFTDIGNVWLLHKSPDLPGGVFKFNTFVSELGIDVGIGLRLDFKFFIFRLDPAIPIRMPSAPGNRWYFDKLQFKDIVWNFGIGYPF